jgi:tetratricopeptide (TPR) repeat protein
VLDLRNTLSQVAKSVQPQYSVEDIDDYVSGKLQGKELEEFEEEISKNRTLRQEVEMHFEMEEAVSEIDIRSLRNEMAHIMETETSWNVSEESIEQFIDSELEGELLKDFNEELEYNTDLKAELALRRNVNEAVNEKDIFSLRDKLQQVKEENEDKEIKSIIPDTSKFEIRKWWKAGVAVAVIVLTMAGVLNRNTGVFNTSWDNYYTTPEWSPQRSAENASDLEYFKEAKSLISEGQLEQAVEVYSEAISIKEDNKFPYQFWKAATLQEMRKYNEAISQYNKVIEHGDNNFIEEAEWHRSYCYIKLEEWDTAKEQLLAIIERKGYYADDASAILRKLRYSLR